MELNLSVDGGDRPADAATDLSNWLREGRLEGVEQIRQEQIPPKPGEQGPMLIAVLTVVLAGPAVTQLVKSVFRYMEARRPKTKITLKVGKKSVVIDCTNPPPVDELVAAAKALVEE